VADLQHPQTKATSVNQLRPVDGDRRFDAPTPVATFRKSIVEPLDNPALISIEMEFSIETVGSESSCSLWK
jgi:hypothetical protein